MRLIIFLYALVLLQVNYLLWKDHIEPRIDAYGEELSYGNTREELKVPTFTSCVRGLKEAETGVYWGSPECDRAAGYSGGIAR